VWIGTSSLAIQYWKLYCLINEHNRTIAKLWDGENLMCTFRRCVDRRIFDLSEEALSIAASLELTTEEYEPVWQYNSSGLYSSQSLYAIIIFRGVTIIYVSAVWKLMVPPRVHSFLWLL
jgi:hypothetical protein